MSYLRVNFWGAVLFGIHVKQTGFLLLALFTGISGIFYTVNFGQKILTKSLSPSPPSSFQFSQAFSFLVRVRAIAIFAVPIIAISVLSSVDVLLPPVLKGAFAVSLISVIIILKNLDNLHLFEGFIGERSAKDVVSIVR